MRAICEDPFRVGQGQATPPRVGLTPAFAGRGNAQSTMPGHVREAGDIPLGGRICTPAFAGHGNAQSTIPGHMREAGRQATPRVGFSRQPAPVLTARNTSCRLMCVSLLRVRQDGTPPRKLCQRPVLITAAASDPVA